MQQSITDFIQIQMQMQIQIQQSITDFIQEQNLFLHLFTFQTPI